MAKFLCRFHVIERGTCMLVASQLDDVEPTSHKKTLSVPNANKWKELMQEVIESMLTNQV